MSKEAMKLALEALRMPCNFWNKVQFIRVTEAISALEEALAKQEQPTVRIGNCLRVGVCASEGHKIQAKQEQGVPEVGFGNIKQEQGEPVATVANLYPYRRRSCGLPENINLYTQPQQRTWVGLTNDEFLNIWYNSGKLEPFTIKKNIEAELKEKNT